MRETAPPSEPDRATVEVGESEARYRALAEATLEAMCIHEGGRVLEVNAAAVALFGYPREEVVGMLLDDLIDPSSHPALLADAEAKRDEARVYLARRKDGSALPIETTVRSCTYRGRPARVAVARDLTAQRRGEAAVRASEERFRLVARATNDAIWEMDLATGEVVRADTFAALFGYAPEEVGRSEAWWRERVHPEDGPRIDAALEAFRASGAESYADEYRFRRADGSYAHVFDRSVIMRDAAGVPARVIGAMMDVTERRRLERKLEQSDRLASLGTLAAGVAHEINNPLSYVIANVRLVEERLRALGDRLATSEVARGDLEQALAASAGALEEAREGAERVHRIVADLKTFARADEADRRAPVDVRRVLEAAVHLSGHEVRRRARLVSDLGEAPRVLANEARLGQVFLTLLRHAVESIAPGSAESNEVRVSLRGAGDRVIIEVADTGPGLPADARARIFDPFFSARAPVERAGLGLSMCHTLVTGLGGEIQVESEIGRGSVFRVSLPAASESAPASSSSPPPSLPPPASRSARVLVIDDEPMVGRMVERALGRAHRITTAASGKIALDHLVAGARFDVILCDLMMPHLSGMDVYERVRELAPDQAERMVFLSGGAFTRRARDFLERHPSLDKPFDLRALEAVIQARMG